jgi:hypothetical protein
MRAELVRDDREREQDRDREQDPRSCLDDAFQ